MIRNATWRTIKNRVMGLPLKKRIAVILQCGALAIAALMLVDPRPPANAQRRVMPVVTEGVVSQKDESQDIALGDIAHTLRNTEGWTAQNQSKWNNETGIHLGVLDVRMHDAENSISRFWGGVVVISLFISGSVIVSFRGK